MKTIETGYRIGGKTWISRAWNAGKLTKEDIEAALEPECWDTDEPTEAELRESEKEFALEMFDEEAGIPFETVLEECVTRERVRILAQQEEHNEVHEALQDLYDHWTDDVNDEGQFNRVYAAHKALDDYCRKLYYGEFDYAEP